MTLLPTNESHFVSSFHPLKRTSNPNFSLRGKSFERSSNPNFFLPKGKKNLAVYGHHSKISSASKTKSSRTERGKDTSIFENPSSLGVVLTP